MKYSLLIFVLILTTPCFSFGDTTECVLNLKVPKVNTINKTGEYSLRVDTYYYTSIYMGNNSIVDNLSIKTAIGHEQETLYVINITAKFFGATFNVLIDDKNYLIISRSYAPSGLTETITINKKTGVGIDVKTKAMDVGGDFPSTTSYILKCYEI